VWIFGDVWCSVWLAVDVWMCTASILNLCAISLDRYVAVTRPPEEADIKDGWVPNPPCEWTCELTNDAGYVVYSALGSFYIPMFVMLFFYWRIYKAAVRTTKAINQGFRTTKEQICPAHENSMSSSRSPSPSLYAVHYERDGRELTESRLRVKRFRMETKAAKTLGIIVGGFVFCWLPFFSVYVVRAFCGDCVSPIVFSVLFCLLQYSKSSVNIWVCILITFLSHRFAFKRIICKCFCGGGGPRRESDGEGSRRQNNKPTHSHSLEEHDANNHTSTTTSTSAADR
ncbi:hypothetical protein HF086_009072, partial [Spodoptera exigua]